MDKVNIAEKLSQFVEPWVPRIVGELNGQHVKVAKLKGEFVWHEHADEDEMFLILKGQLTIEFRDKKEMLNEGDFIVIPKGVQHRPVADEEVEIMLFEPASTINTGETKSDLTRTNLESI